MCNIIVLDITGVARIWFRGEGAKAHEQKKRKKEGLQLYVNVNYAEKMLRSFPEFSRVCKVAAHKGARS